ncbi:hypothetical protein T440DRAFT_75640 [Plenodomus tracheiphilus IPT5]|uniref:Uncharacterized protein n=1 Tax=Plenodomus tracheiphilus IPT5 TaxID=1408161 RepID=A0A6A7B6A6_9PLEO|nr:hypothetical protein T440DRAFT_75640 [Plenodomus tracheiphilus IPT5]
MQRSQSAAPGMCACGGGGGCIEQPLIDCWPAAPSALTAQPVQSHLTRLETGIFGSCVRPPPAAPVDISTSAH